MSITEHLRKLVASGDETRYAISKATGIDQAALQRFVSGKQITSVTVDKLAAHYGLALQPKPIRKRSVK